MEKLRDLFEKNLDNEKLDAATKKLNRYAFQFLNCEKEFFETINKDNFDAQKGILLGRKMNILKNEISQYVDLKITKYASLCDKLSNFKEKLYILGIEVLTLGSEIPLNLVCGLLQKRSSLEWITDKTSIKEIFERDYYSFQLWEEIYSNDGIDGIARYTALNNKFIRNFGDTLLDFYFDKQVSKEVILNLTSKETVLYDLKSNDQVNVLDYSISFETSDEILSFGSPRKVIEL